MNVQRLGTDYGGWEIDLDLVPKESFIIDAGIGEDMSFSLELIKYKAVKVAAVDPTPRSKDFMHDILKGEHGGQFMYWQSAISITGNQSILMYKNKNLNHASDSLISSHNAVGTNAYTVDTLSITQLIGMIGTPLSVIKLDIEGAEWSVYDQCYGIPQVLIESHSFCIPDRDRAEADMIAAFRQQGYGVHQDKHNYRFFLV